jgi:hypothetical protein
MYEVKHCLRIGLSLDCGLLALGDGSGEGTRDLEGGDLGREAADVGQGEG